MTRSQTAQAAPKRTTRQAQRDRQEIDVSLPIAYASKLGAANFSPSGEKRKRHGRPAFKPTLEMRRQVETLSGLGLRHDEILQLILNPHTGQPIDKKTLYRYFRAELDAGPPKLNSMVAQSIARRALDLEHPQGATCAIWFSKCRMGWRETVHVSAEIKSGVLVPPPQLSPERWIEAAAERSAGQRDPANEAGGDGE